MTSLMILFLVSMLRGESQTDSIAIIVHKAAPIQSADAHLIGEFYALETKRWSNGEKIILFNLKSKSLVKERFFKYIGHTATELQKTWMRHELTGEAKAPNACKTEAEIVKKVAETPNAIGYVSLNVVTEAVKIIAKIE